MPLAKSVARNLVHLRDISLCAYEREDGLIDIEAHMTDRRTMSWHNHDRGLVPAGEPIHDMWLRLTLDGETMLITGCEAAMDGTPHLVCPGVAPNYQRLIGLNLSKGFLKGAMQRLAATEGCTHLRELLQQVGTVAMQTLFAIRYRNNLAAGKIPVGISPALLNTCYAYAEDSPVVRRANPAPAV